MVSDWLIYKINVWSIFLFVCYISDNQESGQADGYSWCRWPSLTATQMFLLYEGLRKNVPLSFTGENYSISSMLI
jgi:hypothetical protein